MHTIVNAPSVFTCKTPTAGWINLALVRQLEHEVLHGCSPVIVITWVGGDKQTFTGLNATTILQAWEDAAVLLQQRCNCNHRFKNRRL